MIQLTSHGRRGGLGVRFLRERCLLHPESRMLDSKPSIADFFVKTFFKIVNWSGFLTHHLIWSTEGVRDHATIQI